MPAEYVRGCPNYGKGNQQDDGTDQKIDRAIDTVQLGHVLIPYMYEGCG